MTATTDANFFSPPSRRFANPRTAIPIGLALAIATLALPARAATVYRCTDAQGHVAFSENPCGTGADRIELTDTPTNGLGMGVEGDFSETVQANRERAYERDVARHRQRIRELTRTRDDRLAALRARQADIGKTRDSAARRRLLAAEIRAVANDYNARLRLERDRLAQLVRPPGQRRP
ncbi:MAG: DUF4124 domain-containing protein [Gammaproteobacteria bacterium]|nr:DUF4124 domain-containing protein [Gammaproteobacteria bacterium]